MIWFVHAATGSDSNVGWRKDAPFATLAQLASVMVAGDRAYLAGTFRENVTFTGLVDCYIGQWTGQTKYTIRGDTVITGFSSSGGGYTKTLSAGLNIKSVVVNWDASVNQNGLHYGHLDLAADAATALAGPNKWFYNSGTGVLSINTGANPATQTVAWCKGGVNGFNLSNCTNCVVDNFKAALWCDSTPGTGYAFIGYGTGNTLRVDRTDDCGYHHCGFVGGVCANNVIEPSLGGEGVCAGNATGGIPLVFYTNQNGQAGNVGRDIRIFASPFLKLDGATGTHSGTIGGIYSHTDGAHSFDGVTWERIWITYPYTVGVNSCGVDAGNTTRVGSANETSYLNYGVKAIECRIDGASAPGLNLNAGMADVRCSYNFAGGATKSQSTGILYSTASGVARTRLMDSCEVLCNLGNSGSTAANVVRGWTNDRWVFLNCSFAESGTGTNERRFFAPVGSSASIKARQCVFAFTASAATFRRFYNGDSYANTAVSNGIESLAPRDFEDCAYMGIATGQYSSYTTITYNTSAGWTTNLDAGAQHTSTNPFEEPATHARLKRSHALWTYRDTGTSSHTSLGINRKGWTGTLGCYQLNGAATANWPAMTATPPPARRRPSVYVNCQTGEDSNPYRIRQDLLDDPETYLEAVFVKAGAAGMDVILSNVAGHNGTHYYTANPWQNIPNQIKDVLWSKIEEWRYTYRVSQVGVYQGAVWGTSQAASSPVKPLMYPDWEDEAVADTLDSWFNMGVTIYGDDATANRGNDQYSESIDDQFDSLGGFEYWACGMLPIGEAVPVDNVSSPTDFDDPILLRCEFVVDQSYYSTAGVALKAVLDGTLPARNGLHWLYFASQFTRMAAQARVDQGYIVGVYEDVSAADMLWVGGQVPAAGSAGSTGSPSAGSDFDPPVPPAPTPQYPSNARTMGRGRVGRARRPSLTVGAV